MRTLYVIYDSRCGLCTEVKEWLIRQPAYVPLRLIAADSAEANALYPRTRVDEVAVISDKGEVWLGNRAWIIVLWALRRYRAWSRRLANPMLQPFARQAYAAIAHNRIGISKLLGLRSEAELKRHLEGVTIPACRIQPNG